jgi:hypothetical protein
VAGEPGEAVEVEEVVVGAGIGVGGQIGCHQLPAGLSGLLLWVLKGVLISSCSRRDCSASLACSSY